MWSDRRKPTRSQPRPDGAVRLWVEQLDYRCLPSAVWPEVSSFAGDGSDAIAALPPVFVPPTSDVAAGGNVLLPPPPVTVSPDAPPPQEVPRGVSGSVGSALPLFLPTPAFNGPLIAVPEGAAANRAVTIDWGDGVTTGAVLAPDVAGWLAVRVNRLLAGSATYYVNVLLTAADDPADRLAIPLQVMTPAESLTASLAGLNATGYRPPMPVEVKPSEWLWVSLPVFRPPVLAPPDPPRVVGGFTPPLSAPPPTSEPTTPSAKPPTGGPETPPAPPPGAGTGGPPPAPAGPFTSPPGAVTVPVDPPVVHPASYSPFEAGATRAAVTFPVTPRVPPPLPEPVAPLAGIRPGGPRADEKSATNPTSKPAGPPDSWDWVVALGVGPLELAAASTSGRAGQTDGTPGRGENDRDSPSSPASESHQGTTAPRGADTSDTGTADLWVPPPDAGRPLDPLDPAAARQLAHDSADGSPEAILAALAAAPAPDAVFVGKSQPDEPSEDRRERWSWRSGVMALAATVGAGVWFLWPRLGLWARPVDSAAVVDGPTLTRDETVRPANPKPTPLRAQPAPCPVEHSACS